METIKIGRKEFVIKPGDYISYNGACYLFCSGDGRTLIQKGFDSIRHIQLTNKIIKEIPFDTLRKAEKDYHGFKTTQWYFP